MIIQRWKRAMMRMMGMVVNPTAAFISPQGISYTDVPLNMAMPTGTVYLACEGIRVNAKTNSFQQNMKTRTAVTAREGLLKGMIILYSISKEEKPSINAASSSS